MVDILYHVPYVWGIMGKFKSTQESRSVNHIYNQQPSRAAYVLAWAFVIGLALLAIFLLAISVLEDAGWNGERFIAEVIFWPAYVAGLSWVASRIWNYFAAQSHLRRLELERERRETLAVQHRLQSSVSTDLRELDPQVKRRNALIIQLVSGALAGENNLSYRKAGKLVLTGESEPVGVNSPVVADALKWLRAEGYVSGNAIVEGTTLSAVQMRLYAPVLKNP